MTDFNRREFLRRGAVGLGTLAGSWLLSGCGRAAPAGSEPASTPVALSPTRATEAIRPAQADAFPDLVVSRGGEPEELVRRTLAALGGMDRFVKPSQTVIIKPNICTAYYSFEYAATTNPWVVAALVKLALVAGAGRVRVLDYPFGGSPEEAYVRSGIQEQVLAAGGEMETISRLKFVPVELPQAVDLHQCQIYEEILKADVLINVPIAKHHSLARLTLGMKNLMGVIQNRAAIHQNLGQRLADLAGYVRPTLTVVDAVRVLTNHGPTGGSLDDVKKLDTVIASADIVAADSYAARLFDLRPADLAYIQAGAAMGLGRSDLDNLKIEELTNGG